MNQAAELWATGAINITATLTDTLEADAYGGAGSLVAALGAQVAVINDHANVGAWLDNGTSTADGVIVHKTSALTITATATHADTEEVFGLSVGSIAGGAAVSDINVDGSTKAYVGNYAQLNAAGALGLLGGVQVHATETVVASNTNTESTGGIGAGTGNRANITMGGEVDAAVGAYATLRSIGAVDIEATFIPQLSTNIRGVSVGGLAVGVSETHVTVSTIVNAALDAFTGSTTGHALVVAGALRVAASVARKPKTGGLEDSVHAYALGASGALIGANGSVVTADWTGPVNAWLGEASSVTINIPASDPGGLTAGSAAVSATTDIRQYGEASSIAAGLIGVGVATATVTTNQNVTAWVGAGSTLTAASLAVAATSKSDNRRRQRQHHHADRHRRSHAGRRQHHHVQRRGERQWRRRDCRQWRL